VGSIGLVASAIAGVEKLALVGIAIGSGFGAAWIIFTLLRWKRNKCVVRGKAIGWIVAALLIPTFLGASGAVFYSSTPEPKSQQSENKTAVQTHPEQLPSVSVQSGEGHPAFKIARQSPRGDEIIAIVVSEKTSDEDVVKLLWYFRSMVAEHRWKDLGIDPPHVLPSGVTTGMFVVYKGAKCAQEMNPDLEVKDLPCGRPADHDSGFYQWGIPTDPTNDEAALTRGEDEQRVFASADDHWKISDQVNRALLQHISDAELLQRADTLLAESTVSRISEDDAAMYLNEYDHRHPNNENAHAKKTAERLVAVRQTRELAKKENGD
jgi:hypothetical protein